MKNPNRKRVRCWRCSMMFPEGTRARKVGFDSHFVDRFEHVRSHWEDKHLKDFKEGK
jgi:hypothetical protein